MENETQKQMENDMGTISGLGFKDTAPILKSEMDNNIENGLSRNG